MCKHSHQHCSGRVCVCVECGNEIPCLDWQQFDELYARQAIRFSRELAKEREANKQLAIPRQVCYNLISKKEIYGARQIA